MAHANRLSAPYVCPGCHGCPGGPAYDTSVVPVSGVSRATITLTFYDSDLAPHYNLAVPIASAPIPVARSVAPSQVRPPGPMLAENMFPAGESLTKAPAKKASSIKPRSQSVDQGLSSRLSPRVSKRGSDDLFQQRCVHGKVSRQTVAALKRSTAPSCAPELEVKRMRTDYPSRPLTPFRTTAAGGSCSDCVPQQQLEDHPTPNLFGIPSPGNTVDDSYAPSPVPGTGAPSSSPEAAAAASSQIHAEESELPTPDHAAAAPPPCNPPPAPEPVNHLKKQEILALKLGLRRAKLKEKVKEHSQSNNSTGSLRTMKAESWVGMTPRTLEEMTCTVRAGGSILRDVINLDSVAVN
jgi:hypothetical protein